MTVQELKQRVQLLETSSVIGRFVKLKRKGVEFQGLCPFHEERTPSFQVNNKKGIFKCFGCGASGDAIEFIQKHERKTFLEALAIIAGLENIPVSMDRDRKEDKGRRGPKPSNSFKIINPDIVAATLKAYQINSFAASLADRYSGNDVDRVLLKYYVGTAKNGATIFWQIDQFQRARTGNLILYGPGMKRRKDVPPRRLFTTSDGYEPCLFGEHLLLQADREDLICIVESEKTAILASMTYPELFGRRAVWLACSGSNGLTEEKIWPLSGMNVCLVPDFSWLSRAVWGLTEVRRDEKGKMNPAGEIDPDYFSRTKALQQIGCTVFHYDAAPERTDNKDLADLILEAVPASASPVLLEPDFSMFKL